MSEEMIIIVQMQPLLSVPFHGRDSRNLERLFARSNKEIFGFQDRVCCVGGIPDSGQLDTVLVVDVDEEFESVIGQGDEMLPSDVSFESLERLAIATDLAIGGREGNQLVQCLSSVILEVIKRSSNLFLTLSWICRGRSSILNPFHGRNH